MNTVYFDTPGLLDMRAVTTFGLSVKENDNPIGYFGTGLKYAIAILVRNGADLAITTSSGDIYNFSVRTQEFRNVEFNAIYMAGKLHDQELPFTTELGKNWKIWMAFRELYCNTKDENGVCHIGDTDERESRRTEWDTWTRITICDKDFYEAYSNRSKYFIENRTPIMSHNSIEVYDSPSTYMFYKGICVGDLQRAATMTYNHTGFCDLTEDRTISSPHAWEQRITATIASCTSIDIIQSFVLASENSFENKAVFSEFMTGISNEFKTVMKSHAHDHSGRVNGSAQKLYLKHAEKTGEIFTLATLTPVQTKMYAKAIDVCIDLGHQPAEVSIQFVKSLGNGVLGVVIKNQIFISIETFDMGTKMLAGTLMEELIHYEEKISDMTRTMQNFLINRMMSLYEETKGEPL